MPENRYRTLIVASHPVPYAVPVFRALAGHPRLEVHVAYCSLRGARPEHDPEFGATVQWDVPLLDGYPWSHIRNRGSGRESFFGLCNPGLWRLIRKGRFDAILCHLSYRTVSFWVAFFAARLSGTTFLFGTDASSLAPRDGARWKFWVKRAIWPRLFGLADCVIFPSSATGEMMLELGIPREKLCLTPFVIDNDWWTEQASRSDRLATRAGWGVSEQDLVVLFSAKLQSWKRPLDLLRAFAGAAVPDAVLVFAGEGPQRGEIEREAAALGIASRIRLLGFVNQSQLPSVYSGADLFVLPSSYDPCPVVVCEAMVCGLPVLISDEIRGRFDIVKEDVTGGIFPCGDVEALAEKLRCLLGDRARLAALGTNARARMATWSLRENVAATFEAIEKTVSRRGGRFKDVVTGSPAPGTPPATPQKSED